MDGLISLVLDRLRRVPGTWFCLLTALLVVSATSIDVFAADPAPQASPTAASSTAPKLPVLGARGPSSSIDGTISRSSRGRKGPVRLLVERAGGEKITVLVAPDDYCDRVGLSLRNGETVKVEGSMLKGERPILIATSVTSDGKTVKIRDAEGKLIEPDKPAAGAAPAREGKATLSAPAPTATAK